MLPISLIPLPVYKFCLTKEETEAVGAFELFLKAILVFPDTSLTEWISKIPVFLSPNSDLSIKAIKSFALKFEVTSPVIWKYEPVFVKVLDEDEPK